MGVGPDGGLVPTQSTAFKKFVQNSQLYGRKCTAVQLYCTPLTYGGANRIESKSSLHFRNSYVNSDDDPIRWTLHSKRKRQQQDSSIDLLDDAALHEGPDARFGQLAAGAASGAACIAACLIAGEPSRAAARATWTTVSSSALLSPSDAPRTPAPSWTSSLSSPRR